MKTVRTTGFLLALSITFSPLALASNDPFLPNPIEEDQNQPQNEVPETPTDNLFNNEVSDEFVNEVPPEVDYSAEESSENTEVEKTNTQETEEKTESVPRNIKTQDNIDKRIVALHERVPGAFKAKGITFLSISSRKFIGKHLPCEVKEDATLMNAFMRLKLSQGAPVDCREDVTFRTFPYRMYRRAQ